MLKLPEVASKVMHPGWVLPGQLHAVGDQLGSTHEVLSRFIIGGMHLAVALLLVLKEHATTGALAGVTIPTLVSFLHHASPRAMATARPAPIIPTALPGKASSCCLGALLVSPHMLITRLALRVRGPPARQGARIGGPLLLLGPHYWALWAPSCSAKGPRHHSACCPTASAEPRRR